MVSLLMAHGAQLDAENKLGETALHLAAAQGNVTALATLTQQVSSLILFPI